MKNVLNSGALLTLFATTVLLLSPGCKEDDDPGSSTKVNILGGATTSDTYQTAAVSSYGDLAVVAYQRDNNEVRLASYRVSGNSVKLLKTENFGIVSKVNICLVRKDQAVVVVRNTNNELHLIVFTVGSDGSFTRQVVDVRHVTINNEKPSVIRLADGVCVTGAVDVNGKLVLSRWSISPTGLLVQSGNDYTGGAVTELDMTPIHSTRFAVSTRGNTSSAFNATCFDISGNQIVSQGNYSLPLAQKLSVVSVGNDQVVVFNTNASNQLASTTLAVDAGGNFSELDNNPAVVDPATSALYTLKRLDAQFLGNGIILVNAINSADRHVVIPLRVEASGATAVQTGEYASTDLFDLAYSTVVEGKLLTCNRLQSSQKYRLDLFVIE